MFWIMESDYEKAMFEKVADNIRENIVEINNLLNNCEVESNVDKEKILNFMSVDVNTLIKDEGTSEYYDLDKVSKIFEMLESSKSDSKKKNRKLSRSESSISIASVQSVEDVDEIKVCLSEIRSVITSISNCNIEVPDLNLIQNSQAAKSSNFVDLLMKLQKLSKDLESIASTDNIKEHESLHINNELIKNLNTLVQNLSDVELSRSNPIAEAPQINATSFESSNIISSALEAIEKNPL